MERANSEKIGKKGAPASFLEFSAPGFVDYASASRSEGEVAPIMYSSERVFASLRRSSASAHGPAPSSVVPAKLGLLRWIE